MTFFQGFKLMFDRDPEVRKWAKPLMSLAINKKRYEKDGNAMKFDHFNDWIAYHEKHGGKIYTCGQGDHTCDKCGSDW